MNIDPNSPAFPRAGQVVYDQDGKPLNPYGGHGWAEEPIPGLTIRQHFAAMAMQGQIAQLADIGALEAAAQEAEERGITTAQVVAMASVEYADALIAELNKEAK